MNLNTNLVLVTGAAGWLGSRLVESLVRGLPEHDELKSPAANLRIRVLLMPGQDRHIVTGDTDVVVDNVSVATTRREQVTVPGQGADSIRVSTHGAHFLALVYIPELRATIGRAHSQVRAAFLLSLIHI